MSEPETIYETPPDPQPEAPPLTPSFNVGSVVRLKSGGQEMTVIGSPDGERTVVAYGGPDFIHRELFPTACLELVR